MLASHDSALKKMNLSPENDSVHCVDCSFMNSVPLIKVQVVTVFPSAIHFIRLEIGKPINVTSFTISGFKGLLMLIIREAELLPQVTPAFSCQGSRE